MLETRIRALEVLVGTLRPAVANPAATAHMAAALHLNALERKLDALLDSMRGLG
jgi:hypothetical protein